MMATEPLSPYAVSKLAAEHYCLVFHRLYGLPTIALRYFNVFGPRQDPNSPYSGVISRFIDAILSRRSPVIHGDGEQTRDFTFVENVAQANWAACHCRKGLGSAYNIGCASRTSVNKLWATMATLAGVEMEPVYETERPGDVRHSQADVTRAKQVLGLDPQIGLTEGLELTLRFHGALGRRESVGGDQPTGGSRGES
jgi:UDP-glucose 4-epimerase